MKVGSPWAATRKDRIDHIVHRMQRLPVDKMATAWCFLASNLDHLALPDAAPTPRFNDLLIAILSAYYRTKLCNSKVRARLNRLPQHRPRK